MKKFILIISLFLLSACSFNNTNQKIDMLSKENKNLSSSMKSYYEMNLKHKTESDLFELKYDDLLQIISIDKEREYFHYHIYIAPRTNQELVIKSIKILPYGELVAYFNLELSPYNGFNSLDTLMKSPETDIEFTLPNEFYALEYSVIVDNNGNGNIEKSGFNKNKFDDLMKNVEVEIKYTINDMELIKIIQINYEDAVIVDTEEIAKNYHSEILDVFLENKVLNSFSILE